MSVYQKRNTSSTPGSSSGGGNKSGGSSSESPVGRSSSKSDFLTKDKNSGDNRSERNTTSGSEAYVSAKEAQFNVDIKFLKFC